MFISYIYKYSVKTLFVLHKKFLLKAINLDKMLAAHSDKIDILKLRTQGSGRSQCSKSQSLLPKAGSGCYANLL